MYKITYVTFASWKLEYTYTSFLLAVGRIVDKFKRDYTLHTAKKCRKYWCCKSSALLKFVYSIRTTTLQEPIFYVCKSYLRKHVVLAKSYISNNTLLEVWPIRNTYGMTFKKLYPIVLIEKSSSINRENTQTQDV